MIFKEKLRGILSMFDDNENFRDFPETYITHQMTKWFIKGGFEMRDSLR